MLGSGRINAYFALQTPARVGGFVTDASNSQPLENVAVEDNVHQTSVLTASDGEYNLKLFGDGEHQLEILSRGLAQLDQRSRDILRRRWLDEEKVTLQELADEYGVSAERIRQIEAKVHEKLRSHEKISRLKNYFD